MPTYQYACTACGEQLEAVQAFTDTPLTDCPACSGRLRKVFSAVGVVFKGSGFYKNDSRSTGKAGGGGKDGKDGGSKGDTAAPAKTESAPAATSDGGSLSSSSGSSSSGSSSTPVAKSA